MQTKVINSGTAVVGFILSFLAGSGLVWSIDRYREVEPASDAPQTSASATSHASSPIPISPDDPAWGKADAPVTIVELSDFECPYCARVVPTVARPPTFAEALGDPLGPSLELGQLTAFVNPLGLAAVAVALIAIG